MILLYTLLPALLFFGLLVQQIVYWNMSVPFKRLVDRPYIRLMKDRRYRPNEKLDGNVWSKLWASCSVCGWKSKKESGFYWQLRRTSPYNPEPLEQIAAEHECPTNLDIISEPDPWETV